MSTRLDALARLAVAGVAWAPGVGLASDPIQLLGQVEVRHLPATDEPRFGGLSGLDYDRAADRWLAVSDDREGRPRYYWLAVDHDERSVRAATVVGSAFLDMPARGKADLESLRVDFGGDRIWFVSEGDAAKGSQPFVAVAPRAGREPLSFPLPAGFRYEADRGRGMRPNLAMEGLALVNGTGTLWTALEAPLLEDGPQAGPAEGALIRLTEHSRSGEIVRQLAYRTDPIPAALADGRRASNGVAEILAFGRHHLLVLERAGAEYRDGEWRFAVKLFQADLRDGETIDPRPLGGRAILPVRKWLLFDFAGHSCRVDNLEGLSWGRRLPDGRETLVVISDDNFSPFQSTQLWVLAMETRSVGQDDSP